jgi:pimeloyl-ACP methyl ester carboxylesterase
MDETGPEPVPRDVPAPDGTRLRLWTREASTAADERADEAVLFVHGATYPGRAVFDPAPELSWLAHAAERGRSAYALDLRGYGDSETPVAMDAAPGEAEPPCRAATVADDVAAAVAAIGESRVHLVGYSWGTVVCGELLARNTDASVRAASFTAFAPVFRPAPSLVEGFALGDPPAPARRVTRQDALDRWTAQFPDAVDPFTYRDPAVFPQFWNALHDSGQVVAANVPTVRAPNGVLVDLRGAVDAEPYDPSRVTVPSFVVRGSFDPTATREDALGLYDALPNARGYREVAGGTHFLPLEKRRGELFDAVATFQDGVGGGRTGDR